MTAYVNAVNAHDCGTAEGVMTAGAKESAKSWCQDVGSLSDVVVKTHFTERPKWSGHTPPEQVAKVPVTFNLNWRPFHNDGSMDEGPTVWGYSLVRESADAPWRIFNQGIG